MKWTILRDVGLLLLAAQILASGGSAKRLE
jgi:hypothetical protein